jgi:hypothetical protein
MGEGVGSPFTYYYDGANRWEQDLGSKTCYLLGAFINWKVWLGWLRDAVLYCLGPDSRGIAYGEGCRQLAADSKPAG